MKKDKTGLVDKFRLRYGADDVVRGSKFGDVRAKDYLRHTQNQKRYTIATEIFGFVVSVSIGLVLLVKNGRAPYIVNVGLAAIMLATAVRLLLNTLWMLKYFGAWQKGPRNKWSIHDKG